MKSQKREVRCTCRYPAGICRIGAYLATDSRKSSCVLRSPVEHARRGPDRDRWADRDTRDCLETDRKEKKKSQHQQRQRDKIIKMDALPKERAEEELGVGMAADVEKWDP